MQQLTISRASTRTYQVFELYAKGYNQKEISKMLSLQPNLIKEIIRTDEFKAVIEDWKKHEIEYNDVYLQSEYIKYRDIAELATKRLTELIETGNNQVALAACKHVLNRTDQLRRDQTDSRIRELESFVMSMALQQQQVETQPTTEPRRMIRIEDNEPKFE